VCVHGHFYQPPRENPWTGRIDREPSAAPWENWNERIADECYGPNTAAELRGAGGEGRRRNNFASISFNVGPTLMAWLAERRPAVHRAIVEADAAGTARPGGHGGAIAQVHDHLIMPLAAPRDQRTQVRWGLADFSHRFGRAAEGMWLPETAVDVPTLEALAAEGVRFTILAPHQAARIRRPGGSWTDVAADGGLDTGRAYLQRLPSGREIVLFFYDGDVAHGIAFDGLLHDGAELTRLLEATALAGEAPRLGHVATDGETYGHHHAHGEMALAWALDAIERHGRASLTTYGAWLARHPPVYEVACAERTSWSCVHGVRRWAGGCDCGTGGAGWDYAWRAPLRRALDDLRGELARRYEAEAGELLRDPWAARDECAELWLGREPVVEDWWHRHLRPGADRTEARRWLEMERSALRMFTSCGWFFDDPAGLETRQVLRYAARALDLAGLLDAGGMPDTAAVPLLEGLTAVRSNLSDDWNGADELRRILLEDRPRVGVSRPTR
jgi:alpha-amylase/alpha-mannosidase (GH57 family)